MLRTERCQRSHVEVEFHLVGMRAIAHLIVLLVHLEGDPALDQVLAEHTPSQQEIVIDPQRVQRFLKRGGQWLDSGSLFVRPGADVTAKHRRLLPAVWASLAANSLAYWGAAYLLLTMAWLG